MSEDKTRELDIGHGAAYADPDAFIETVSVVCFSIEEMFFNDLNDIYPGFKGCATASYVLSNILSRCLGLATDGVSPNRVEMEPGIRMGNAISNDEFQTWVAVYLNGEKTVYVDGAFWQFEAGSAPAISVEKYDRALKKRRLAIGREAKEWVNKIPGDKLDGVDSSPKIGIDTPFGRVLRITPYGYNNSIGDPDYIEQFKQCRFDEINFTGRSREKKLVDDVIARLAGRVNLKRYAPEEVLELKLDSVIASDRRRRRAYYRQTRRIGSVDVSQKSLEYFRPILRELLRCYGSIENMRGLRGLELGPTQDSLGLFTFLAENGVSMTAIGDGLYDLSYPGGAETFKVGDYNDYLASCESGSFDFAYSRLGLYIDFALPGSNNPEDVIPMDRDVAARKRYLPLRRVLKPDAVLIRTQYGDEVYRFGDWAGQDVKLDDGELAMVGFKRSRGNIEHIEREWLFTEVLYRQDASEETAGPPKIEPNEALTFLLRPLASREKNLLDLSALAGGAVKCEWFKKNKVWAIPLKGNDEIARRTARLKELDKQFGEFKGREITNSARVPYSISDRITEQLYRELIQKYEWSDGVMNVDPLDLKALASNIVEKRHIVLMLLRLLDAIGADVGAIRAALGRLKSMRAHEKFNTTDLDALVRLANGEYISTWNVTGYWDNDQLTLDHKIEMSLLQLYGHLTEVNFVDFMEDLTRLPSDERKSFRDTILSYHNQFIDSVQWFMMHRFPNVKEFILFHGSRTSGFSDDDYLESGNPLFLAFVEKFVRGYGSRQRIQVRIPMEAIVNFRIADLSTDEVVIRENRKYSVVSLQDIKSRKPPISYMTLLTDGDKQDNGDGSIFLEGDLDGPEDAGPSIQRNSTLGQI